MDGLISLRVTRVSDHHEGDLNRFEVMVDI